MLVIRFFRVGKKNQPSYKIVVTDKRKPPASGRFVEEVGFYNPLTKEKVLKGERIKYWLSVGAKPSDTVYNLLIKEGVLEGKKIPLHKKSKKTATAEASVPAPEGVLTDKPVNEPASAEAPAGKEKPIEETKEVPEVAKEEIPPEKSVEEVPEEKEKEVKTE